MKSPITSVEGFREALAVATYTANTLEQYIDVINYAEVMEEELDNPDDRMRMQQLIDAVRVCANHDLIGGCS